MRGEQSGFIEHNRDVRRPPLTSPVQVVPRPFPFSSPVTPISDVLRAQHMNRFLPCLVKPIG